MTRLVAFIACVLLMAALVWYAVTHFQRPGATVIVQDDSGRPPIATLGPLGAGCGEFCGKLRWAVKTLSDVDRDRVDLRPVPATVESLTTLPPPDHIQNDRRVGPVELTTYEVIGCLGIVDRSRTTDLAVHRRMAPPPREQDKDVHLVIGGLVNPRLSLIAEIPSRECRFVCRSGLVPYFDAARAVVDSILQFGPVSPECNNDVPLVRVTGVGFFDREHRQTGAAPNGIELHPVLALSIVGAQPTARPRSPDAR